MTWMFNAPPGWPVPAGFVPPPGWAPDPAWPPAPAGWVYWLPSGPAGDAPDPRRRATGTVLIVVGVVVALVLSIGVIGTAAGLGWYVGHRVAPGMNADDACSYAVDDLLAVDPDTLPTPRQARVTADDLQASADEARAAADRDAQYTELADALDVVAGAWSTIADLPDDSASWSIAQRREVAGLAVPVRAARATIDARCSSDLPAPRV